MIKFTKLLKVSSLSAGVISGITLNSSAADLVIGSYNVVEPASLQLPIFAGRVQILDGRTLRFPRENVTVKLMDIDTCELPQWTYDGKVRKPVPCGGFAKAWLKRTIGNEPVICEIATYSRNNTPMAYCFQGKHDVGLEMLRVGWARVSTPHAQNPNYIKFQERAIDARYGMWKDYILDMNVWRKKAVDKTVSRQPIADYNLLVSRKGVIGPAIADLRNKPKRRNR